jgi:D-alanyl-D-alanine carboxypeptidase/D-alanyl-D-alanine-endopeptidase (penicillin-binding protein 4)
VSSRWRWVAVVVVLVVAAAGGTAYVVTRPATVHRSVAIPAPVVRTAAMTAVGSTGATTATAGGVAAALAPATTDPAFGGSLTGMVVDAATGAVLLDRDGGTPMTPASTVKLLTAAVALTTLGPTATLHTDVLRAGTALYLRGGGDVTLSTKQLARAARSVTGNVTTLCADVSAWSGPLSAPGWSPGYFTGGDVEFPSPLELDEGRVSPTSHARVAHPAGTALAAFAAALKAAGVPVNTADCVRAAPPTAIVVATLKSAPVSALVASMLTASDNDLAEALGRAVAKASGSPASRPAGCVSSTRVGCPDSTGSAPRPSSPCCAPR